MKARLTSCLLALAMAFSVNSLVQADDYQVGAAEEGQEQIAVSSAQSLQVDINQADAKQLSQLKNIGLKKAQSIVLYREQNGPFANLDDLKKVKGIGKAIVEKNRAFMVIAQQ